MKSIWFTGIVLGCSALACSSSDKHESGAAGASSTAGASNAGGAAGSGGASGAGSASLCSAQFDAMAGTCGLTANDRDANVQDCLDQEKGYAGIGCADEFDAWLRCTTTPAYDCTQDTGCEFSQNAYFSCQSQAVQRTGCVRLGAAQDAQRCTDASKPYTFSCLSTAPSSCTQVVKDGAGIWCCPQL